MKNGINSSDINSWPPRIKIVYQRLLGLGFEIESYDIERPWGGFFVIDKSDTQKFIHQFYNDWEEELTQQNKNLSPKILCVAPGKQLSWQYHHRRAELWKLVSGKAAYKKSLTDEEGPIEILETHNVLRLICGERHRLIGLNEWGIIAEIWQHTDPHNPSDEEDIVRLQDDFGRS